MPESFNYIPEIQNQKERLDTNQTNLSFTDVENNIRQNYETNSTISWADNLALKQYQTFQEKIKLKENKEIQVQSETKEKLDKEAMINEVKTMLYEKLWIDNNQENNNSLENFTKWIVDELILNNYDLAIQVWETNWKILIDSIKYLFTWEWLKQIAEWLKESIWNIFTWNAYEKWKSIAELWLITTWVLAWTYIWKKGLKLWMKEISRLRVNKERLVESSKLKQVVWDTRNKVNKIVPKQEIDFEKALVEDIAKLWDKQRLEAASFYLKKQLTKQEQEAILKAHNIWIDRDWAWIYNYTQTEILEKSKILKEAWFSKEERRILLEKGVCAKISKEKIFQDLDIKWNNLEEKVNFLFNMAEQTRVLYDNLLENIWKKSNWIEILNSKNIPLKDKKTVLSKIETEYDWKHVEKVRDILRWSIVYEDISDLMKGLIFFKKSDNIRVIHITNRLSNISTNDILLNIKFPNWFVSEVQLHIKETLIAKEKWYKLTKDIINIDNVFKKEDYILLEELKQWKYWWRELKKDINLPKNNEIVNTHSIYEIIRSLDSSWLKKSSLYKDLQKVQEKINLYARKLYKKRTWKKFN